MHSNRFDLLIIYRDGGRAVVRNVESYGTTNDNDRLFYYKKNHFKSFMPIDAISFIGTYHDYINFNEMFPNEDGDE